MMAIISSYPNVPHPPPALRIAGSLCVTCPCVGSCACDLTMHQVFEVVVLYSEMYMYYNHILITHNDCSYTVTVVNLKYKV